MYFQKKCDRGERVILPEEIECILKCSSRVEKITKDAKIYQIYEGSSQIQRLVVSRDLFKGMLTISNDNIPLPSW